ncbi:MAG: hypothetical protein GZ087_04095 [Flavobacterium sp.]|nr:hypothetical protein [Flavobacterium sp.]
MKNLFFSLMVLFLFSCNNDERNNNFNATVIGAGECSYLIKFDDNVIDVPTNTSQNIFYEINLPNQFKVNNLRINISFRQPTNNEIMACTTRDYAYPQIFIEKVN